MVCSYLELSDFQHYDWDYSRVASSMASVHAEDSMHNAT